MPLYEYECTQCGQRTEELQRHGDAPLAKCPHCGGAVRKLFSAPAVQFKGSGWYVTDYGGKSKPPPSAKGSGEGEKAGKSSGDGAAGGKKAAEAKSSSGGDKSSGSKE